MKGLIFTLWVPLYCGGCESWSLDEFKYLWSTIQSNKERWMSAGRVEQVEICDRRRAARVKGMVYRMVAGPAVMDGLILKSGEAELTMLRSSFEVATKWSCEAEGIKKGSSWKKKTNLFLWADKSLIFPPSREQM